MRRLLSSSLALFIFFCLLVGSERRAWGYIDPGSGLIALQTVASVAAAYAYYVRRRILAFFSRKDKKKLVAPVTAEAVDPREAA
jgi:hypothetical protein